MSRKLCFPRSGWLQNEVVSRGCEAELRGGAFPSGAWEQLIFDTNDPKSAMRGHSLGRSIYGSPGGTVPFNGLGRPHPDTTTRLTALTPIDSINVPYTYPDINNPFLATIDANGVFQE